MRGEYQTQMFCISETNSALFQLKMNETLKTIVNPDIRMDPTRPFTAYIFYTIQHDIPETITEALEMIEGDHHYCSECPALIRSEDHRKKWHFCHTHMKKVRQDNPACIDFYKLRDIPDLLENSDFIKTDGHQNT